MRGILCDLRSTIPCTPVAAWRTRRRKYRFPVDEWRWTTPFALVSDELMLDGNSRMNLATFCQTWEEPAVHRLMDLAIDKNMIDKDEYPQTAELERRCVHMLADLWNAPESANTVGASAIGSSRPACWAGWPPSGGGAASGPRPGSRPIGRTWCAAGAGRLAQVRQVLGRRDARGADVAGHYAMDADDMLARVDENTIMVVPTFGVTHRRLRVRRAAVAALDDLQERTGLDVDIHVDGASGAFLAPFCAPDVVWDFRLPREVDQHVGAQVRSGAARRRLDRLAGRRRAA